MTLKERKEELRKLSPELFQGLSWVCIGQWQRVPRSTLVKLRDRDLVYEKPTGEFAVASYQIHHAWGKICDEFDKKRNQHA